MTTVYYYAQTFETDPKTHLPTASSLAPLFADATLQRTDTLVVYLASLHFGATADEHAPYLHLNDTDVNALDIFFADVQHQCGLANCAVDIRVMLGGAGGAYTTLYSNYDVYYNLLKAFLLKYPFIRGIDLDVEETLDDEQDKALAKIQTLVRMLHADFGSCGCSPGRSAVGTPPQPPPAPPPRQSFAITLAPVGYSLTSQTSLGMGGFSYYDLYSSEEGSYISHFNVQAYGCYDFGTFQEMLRTGYAADRLVMGMLGDDFGSATPFVQAMTELQKIRSAHRTTKGAILWEYGDTHIDGVAWGQAVRRVWNGCCGGGCTHHMNQRCLDAHLPETTNTSYSNCVIS